MRFSEIVGGIAKTGVLSLDLETEPIREGLDPRNPEHAKVSLIAMASGKGNGIKAVAVTPTEEAVQFMVEHLKNPEVMVVGHNLFSYDFQVLHHRGIIGYDEIRAKTIDTIPLSWLYNENIPHGLKPMVMKLFKYEMVTYAEAFFLSPNMVKIRGIEKEIKEFQKKTIDRVGIETRKMRAAVKKEAMEEYRKRWAKRNTKADRERKKRVKENMLEALEERYGPEAIEQRKMELHESTIRPQLEKIENLKRLVEKDQRKYARDDARQTLRLYFRLRREMFNRNLTRWTRMENDVRRIASEMELNGIKIDFDRLNDLDKILEKTTAEFQANVFNISRQEFNLNSPKQIQKVLYDDLQIPPLDPSRSTDEKVLSRLDHEIGQAILDYRVVQKLRSTYARKIKEKVLEDRDGRLHGRFNTNGPVTGRWSSSGPNLQNIPSRRKASEYDERIQAIGPRIRDTFVASKGHRLVCADLSQIELRLIAHYTGDANLLRVYQEHAIHDEIVYYTGDIHDETRREVSKMVGFDIGRKLAKNLNFGLCYGMFPKKFAVYAKLYKPGTKSYDVAKAEMFRNGFFNLWQGILDMIEGLHALRQGDDKRPPMVRFRTISGRTRYYPRDEWVNGGKVFNSIIQGSAADVLKVIVWAIDKYVVKNPKYRGTKLILQVHDEVSLEVPNKIAEEVAILVKAIMEMEWFKISVPTLASAKICSDWGEFNNDAIPEVGTLPPESTGIKPAVAMLTQREREWAAKQVNVECFNSTKGAGVHASSDKVFIPMEDLPNELNS